MKTTLRKTAGVLGGAALALAAVATSAPAAHANPNWTIYNEGTGAPLTSTDVLTATGSIVIGATIAGSPHNITCTFDAANPLKVSGASGTLSGPPGSTLTVNAAPPASLTCKNQAGILVPVTNSGTWGVSFTAPPAPPAGTPSGYLYNGTLTGSLNVPANGVSANLSNIVAGCSATGPTVAKSFAGSYNASSGVVTGNANQTFAVTSTGCVVTSTRLVSASLTANPILDLQW